MSPLWYGGKWSWLKHCIKKPSLSFFLEKGAKKSLEKVALFRLTVVALQFPSLLQFFQLTVLNDIFFLPEGCFNFRFTSQAVIFTPAHFLLKSVGRKDCFSWERSWDSGKRSASQAWGDLPPRGPEARQPLVSARGAGERGPGRAQCRSSPSCSVQGSQVQGSQIQGFLVVCFFQVEFKVVFLQIWKPL